MPPAECDREKDSLAQRQAKEPHRQKVEITRDHVLHRCVPKQHVDTQNGEVLPAAFGQAGMSVFVSGPGFPELNLDEVLKRKSEWVAVASISAADILDRNEETFKFDLLHDPFSDEQGNQHDNHAMVVCKKNPTKATELKRRASWSKPPTTKDEQCAEGSQ